MAGRLRQVDFDAALRDVQVIGHRWSVDVARDLAAMFSHAQGVIEQLREGKEHPVEECDSCIRAAAYELVLAGHLHPPG